MLYLSLLILIRYWRFVTATRTSQRYPNPRPATSCTYNIVDSTAYATFPSFLRTYCLMQALVVVSPMYIDATENTASLVTWVFSPCTFFVDALWRSTSPIFCNELSQFCDRSLRHTYSNESLLGARGGYEIRSDQIISTSDNSFDHTSDQTNLAMFAISSESVARRHTEAQTL